MILLHHFCKKIFLPKLSLTGVLHPGDEMTLFNAVKCKVASLTSQSVRYTVYCKVDWVDDAL